MRIAKLIGVAIVLLLSSVRSFSQQLRLGKNPYALQKSAILELESDNQGLLFPRITDTTLINTLTPPDGMVIFYQPSGQLMVRSNGAWRSLAANSSLSNYWHIDGNSNGVVKKLGNIDNYDLSFITNNTERLRILSSGNVGIGNANPLQKLDVTGNMNLSGAFMPSNNAGTAGHVLRSNGAGTAPSWINLALSNLSDATITSPASGQLLQFNGTKWINFTPNYLSSIDTTNISNFYVKVRGLLSAAAPITFANGQFSIAKATNSVNGYLSSADWTTFNSKLSAVDTSHIANFHLKVKSLLNAGTGISYNNTTGAIANTGVLSVNGNTGALTMDTSYISNFYLKSRSLLSAGTGITYNAGTGVISSSVSTANLWSLTGNAGIDPLTMFLGTTDLNPLPFRTNNLERMRLDENGNFGIGTTGPTQKLDVNGNIRLSGAFMPNNSAGTSGYFLTSAGAGTAPTWTDPTAYLNSNTWVQGGNSVAANKNLGTTSNFPLPFITNNTEKMRLTTAGYLGIGTTAPANYLEVAGTNSLTGVTGLRLSNAGTATPAAATDKLLTVNSNGDVVVASNPGNTSWSLNGNSNTTAFTSFLGTTDNKPLILKSNNSPYAEMGTRSTLSLVQAYPDYTDGTEQILHMKSAVQFYAPAAQFYKPKIYVDANGNFRTKGSSAGTDYFEFGSTGTNNDGGFEFIIGDDGDEPIVFKSYNYITGMSEMMRLQSGRMAVGSNAFDATNPEKLLIDAGVTTSYNLMNGKGSINNYLQINVQNRSNGNTASSDLVATSDNGTESVNYIDMGINSSGFSNTSYPILNGANNAYLYSTGNDFVLGNGTTAKSLQFFTGGFALANERMRIDGNGKVGIGTASPSSILHVKSGTTDVSGVRMENLTSSSATTSGAAVLGVDGSGNVVRAKAPVYYTGGIGGSATVDGITKIWVAEVSNTGSGTQTITIPANVVFTNIIGITLTTKGGTDNTNSPVAMVTSNTTSSIVIRVLESKSSTIVTIGTAEGLEAHTNTSTKIYIRVEGN